MCSKAGWNYICSGRMVARCSQFRFNNSCDTKFLFNSKLSSRLAQDCPQSAKTRKKMDKLTQGNLKNNTISIWIIFQLSLYYSKKTRPDLIERANKIDPEMDIGVQSDSSSTDSSSSSSSSSSEDDEIEAETNSTAFIERKREINSLDSSCENISTKR